MAKPFELVITVTPKWEVNPTKCSWGDLKELICNMFELDGDAIKIEPICNFCDGIRWLPNKNNTINYCPKCQPNG